MLGEAREGVALSGGGIRGCPPDLTFFPFQERKGIEGMVRTVVKRSTRTWRNED